MVGVLVVGFIANLLIHPVAERHLVPADESSGRFQRTQPAPAQQRS
jgi:hypothetical protein